MPVPAPEPEAEAETEPEPVSVSTPAPAPARVELVIADQGVPAQYRIDLAGDRRLGLIVDREATVRRFHADMADHFGVPPSELRFKLPDGTQLASTDNTELYKRGVLPGTTLAVLCPEARIMCQAGDDLACAADAFFSAPAELEPEPEPEPEPPLALPPIPPSPVSGLAFCGTRFHGAYRRAKAPASLMKLGGKLTSVIRGYCEAHDIPYDDDEGEAFFDELQADMVGAGDSMAQAVQRMWTSFRELRGQVFCFILNEVVRNDIASCITPAASLARSINELCVTPEGEEPCPPFPPEFACVRGGGFDNKYRDFFAPGREFRQPAFLATSFLESTADAFMRRSSLPVKVKWTIRIDPARKCRHVNLVTRRVPGLPDEQEYLFAPYSAFTVRSARWAAGTDDDPHVIELDAAPDNVGPSEDLPLAPWS